MMNKLPHFAAYLTFLVLVALLATGCDVFNPPPPATPTELPNILFTQAAETIMAQISQDVPTATITPTPGPATDTPTPTLTYTPTSTFTPTIVPPSTATATLSPTVSPTVFGVEALKDDFTLTDTGWADEEGANYSMGYFDFAYQIYVKVPLAPIYSVRSWYYDDVRLEVDAQRRIGPDDGYVGVVCRFNRDETDDGTIISYYALVISPDGTYTIFKYKGGVLEALLEGTAVAGAINGADQFNRVVGECIGNTLRIYSNDRLLGEVTDSEIKAGGVGLMAGTRFVGELDARFDNFVLLRR
jgi:hypothetical protein